MMRAIVVLAVLALAASASAMPQWWKSTGATAPSASTVVAGTCPQTSSVSCMTTYGPGCCPNGQICGDGTNKCPKGYCCPAGGATCDKTQCTGVYDNAGCKEQFVCPFGTICCSSGSSCNTWADGSVGCTVACFSGDMFVTTQTGKKLVSEVVIGDEVLSYNMATKTFEYSSVYAFLDVEPELSTEFLNIEFSSGSISITAEHLIMRVSGDKVDPIAARRVLVGDLIKLANGEVVAIEKISSTTKVGAFAPATVTGTIVINDVVTSCYAYTSHAKAHAAMAPLRWLWETTPSVLIEETPQSGTHWYAGYLYKLFQGLIQ